MYTKKNEMTHCWKGQQWREPWYNSLWSWVSIKLSIQNMDSQNWGHWKIFFLSVSKICAWTPSSNSRKTECKHFSRKSPEFFRAYIPTASIDLKKSPSPRLSIASNFLAPSNAFLHHVPTRSTQAYNCSPRSRWSISRRVVPCSSLAESDDRGALDLSPRCSALLLLLLLVQPCNFARAACACAEIEENYGTPWCARIQRECVSAVAALASGR